MITSSVYNLPTDNFQQHMYIKKKRCVGVLYTILIYYHPYLFPYWFAVLLFVHVVTYLILFLKQQLHA